MKRIFLALMVLVCCLPTMAQEVETSKRGVALATEYKIVVEARRSSMNFSEIDVEGAIRLVVESRTTGNIIVRAPQSLIPYISLTVSGGELKAKILAGAPASRRSNIVAEVYIPYNGRINNISTSAAAQVVVEPTISCNELELNATSASVIEVSAGTQEASIEASGASQIRATLAADELDAEFSGASTATLSGQVKDADIEVSGASTLRADKLRAANIDIECSGASKASVLGINCSTKSYGASKVVVESLAILNASAPGASTIVYSGECQVNILRNSGASSIYKK